MFLSEFNLSFDYYTTTYHPDQEDRPLSSSLLPEFNSHHVIPSRSRKKNHFHRIYLQIVAAKTWISRFKIYLLRQHN